jgi:hypothetical protein
MGVFVTEERREIDFEQLFARWLGDCIDQGVPDDVCAFSFSLYEPANVPGVMFDIELIGAGEFDAEDPDWTCDEVWAPEPRWLPIPVEYSGEDWETCLEKLKSLVLRQLETDTPQVQVLKASQGIGLGFVDGDLEIIWQH